MTPAFFFNNLLGRNEIKESGNQKYSGNLYRYIVADDRQARNSIAPESLQAPSILNNVDVCNEKAERQPYLSK